ncbi:MAG: AMP-binding protein [Alphaproteobacteria bacterium]|nr:AMP-binding protein [Alphaproteobacteria bacterium]
MSNRFVWEPNEAIVRESTLKRFMDAHGIASYDELIARADDDPEWYWNALIEDLGIPFTKPYDKVFDTSDGMPWIKWCVGGEMNAAASCLGRHRGTAMAARLAVSWESEEGEVKQWTYAELDAETCRLAEGLKSLGLGPGDAIGIYLPMSREVLAAFFAVLHIGAIAVPLFSGFGAEAIQARLNDSEAKAVITADGSRRRGNVVEMKAIMDQAAVQVPTLAHVVVLDYLGAEVAMTEGRDVAWSDLTRDKPAESEATPMPADDPAVLIYTSGTSGMPKGTIVTQCGLAVKPACDFHYNVDMKPDDRLIWLTDFGWAVGPIIAAASATVGSALVLAEGGPDYPDPGRMWRLAQDHEATVLGTAPTAIRALMRHGAELVAQYDLSKLRLIASTGEPWTDEAWWWTFEHVAKRQLPILNWCGGTEIGGGILCSNVLTPMKPCAFSGPIPGMAADIVDEEGRSLPPGEVGELVLRHPSIGLSRGLWKDPDRYIETYWEMFGDLWRQGDWASRDEDGLWYVHGRSDDTIKVSGKRTGPAEIEGLLMASGKVSEAAVIGLPDEIKGQSVACVCVPAPGIAGDEALVAELMAAVVEGMGRSFRPARIIFTDDLPKTRSMKIMRRVIRAVVVGEAPGDLSSMVNPESLESLKAVAPT